MNELRIRADLLAIRAIGPWVRQVLGAHGVGADAIAARCELALQEVAANVVSHGYADHDPTASRTIELHAHVDDRVLTVVVSDRGVPYDPDEQPEPDPDEPQVHGYGLVIVRQLVRRFVHTREGDTNRTLLEFDLPAAAGAANIDHDHDADDHDPDDHDPDDHDPDDHDPATSRVAAHDSTTPQTGTTT